MRVFFDDALFAVAEHFHCLPDDVGHRRVGWLLPVYRRVLRSQWDAQIAMVSSTELAVGRALTQAFGSKKVSLPELPTFDKMMRSKLPPEVRMPAWMIEFERVNRPKTQEEKAD